MIIRRWQESDRPFLRTLYLRARKSAWRWLDSSDWRLEDFDTATLGETVWVAEEDGHRMGFASVSVNDNFLHNLFIDPDFQGKGVGSALLKHAQSTFTHTGTLKCLLLNKDALTFYQHHGWKVEAQGVSPQGDYLLMHYVLK